MNHFSKDRYYILLLGIDPELTKEISLARDSNHPIPCGASNEISLGKKRDKFQISLNIFEKFPSNRGIGFPPFLYFKPIQNKVKITTGNNFAAHKDNSFACFVSPKAAESKPKVQLASRNT